MRGFRVSARSSGGVRCAWAELLLQPNGMKSRRTGGSRRAGGAGRAGRAHRYLARESRVTASVNTSGPQARLRRANPRP